jgi:hypothetical protein
VSLPDARRVVRPCVAAVTLVVVTAIVGCGGSGGVAHQRPDSAAVATTPAASSAHEPPGAAGTGQGPPVRQIIGKATASTAAPRPRSLTVGQPPAAFVTSQTGAATPHRLPPGARWLRVLFTARAGDAGLNAVGSWAAKAAAAATIAHAADAGDPPIVGLTIDAVDDRGTPVPTESMSAPVQLQTPPGGFATDTGALKAALQADATAAGATLATLALEQFDGPAPVVDFTASDATVLQAAARDVAAYAAALVTVHSDGGKLLAVAGSVPAIGLGSGWSDPALTQGSSGVGQPSGTLPATPTHIGEPCVPPQRILMYATARTWVCDRAASRWRYATPADG